jgi:hypothetical protein
LIASKANFPENIFVAKNATQSPRRGLFAPFEVMRGFIGVVMRVVFE